MFDPNRCRNIVVDIKYVLWVIYKYSNASHLIKEMELKNWAQKKGESFALNFFCWFAYASASGVASGEASSEASPQADKVTKDTAAANMIIEKIFFIIIYFNWFLTRQKYN